MEDITPLDQDYLFECLDQEDESILLKRKTSSDAIKEKKVKLEESHPVSKEEELSSEPEDKLDHGEIKDDDKSFEEIKYGKIIELESGITCTHSVAISAGQEYVPLVYKDVIPAKTYPFSLDDFQKKAIQCVQNDQSVLVAAHTSSGKTVVAEYAIAQCLKNHQRVIYTSPIKALSNQKYRELSLEFHDVGLQTGDVTINPTASCIVMTTEILRSMLYRGSEIMREVAWVIFDEIHYMRDKERGVVWEETIILLPDNVRYVFLSATIPNANEFAEWIAVTHSQSCHVVTTDFRPTPLQHYIYPSGGDGIFLVVDENGNFKDQNFEKALDQFKKSGNSGFGNKRGFNKEGASNVMRLTKLITERRFSPVIIFSFSKRECEFYALQISKTNFNSSQEKTMIDRVFSNAMDCLSDDDKKLPQVESVLPLLKRGIGIHHSGLLPILKEVTEILFSEGLIKVLFATETFAMGLNMPARTVVFTSCRKFDGISTRFINSGEYIQMSGRAGRRGIDDRGIVIIIVDDETTPDEVKGLVRGSPDPLNSAFRLTYNMILNLLRLEGVDPEYMMKKSFFQYQLSSKLPQIISEINSLESDLKLIKLDNEEEIDIYMKLNEQIKKIKKQMSFFLTDPKYILPFFQPGRLIRVKNQTQDFGWGCVINYRKKFLYEQKSSGRNFTYIVEALLYCSTKPIETSKGSLPQACEPEEIGEMKVVPVLIKMISEISAIRFNLPMDIRPVDVRRSIHNSIKKTEKRFPQGIPLLDPIEDMGIKDKSFLKLQRQLSKLEDRIIDTPLYKKLSKDSPDFCIFTEDSPELQKYRKSQTIKDRIKSLKQELKSVRSVVQLNDLKARKRVLRRLGFIDSNDIIDIKGRVACEVSSGDELVLTEMIFNSVFNSMTPQQICAILSCFIFQEKSTDHDSSLSDQLSKPLAALQDTVTRIAKISRDCKMIDFDAQAYASSFKTDLMDVTYHWANGADFISICQITDVFEGNIIRCLRRLDELLKQLAAASKCIGSVELEKKFNMAVTMIKRSIAFAASLYL